MNGKRNGKGKEYNQDGILAYEGQYLNGKKWDGKGYDKFNNIIYELKNGKGLIKEFLGNHLIYEGEYAKGERNGNGREYYSDGNLEYEGTFVNGKKNGNGKEYKINGKLEYEGTFLDGKRHGKGKEFYKNGTIEFEGEYLYNFKYKGKYYINQKLEYEGIYEYGNKWDGKGYDEYGNIIYELNNGNGKVKEYEDGELYLEGEYLNGKRNGKCKQYFEGKLVLDGEYLNGIQNGLGGNMMKVVLQNLKVHT